MNNSFKASKVEPKPTFENTINEIKDNHMKSMTSAAMNISAITNFDDKIDPLSMNNIFEAATFEPETKFEKTIYDIKDNHLKSIASAAINPSDITYFDETFDPICIKNIFESAKFEPEPTFENTINEIKDNHIKSITSAAMNISAITNFDDKIDPLRMNNIFESATFEPETKIEKTIYEIKDNHPKGIASTAMNPSDITYFDETFDPICINNIFEPAKFEPEPTYITRILISLV